MVERGWIEAGFIIGDASVITQYGKIVAMRVACSYTTIGGCGDLYSDDCHVEVIRAHYDKSFAARHHSH